MTVGGGAGSTTSIVLAPGSVTTLSGQLNKQGTTFVFQSQGASLFINGTLIGVNGAYNSDVIFAGNTITQSNYTVNSTQTYDGLTEVTSGSHLIMGTANALPASTDVLIDKTGGVPTVLDLNSFNLTIRSLNSVSGDGSNAQVSNSGGAAATLTIAMTGTASNQGIATFNGVISGTNLNLVVHGNSSDATSTAQILAGNNNYSGSTLVSTGALLVASSGTIGGSGVTVGNLGLIGGSGTISSSINVQSGGYVSPGMNTASNSAASAGILHVGSNVSVAGTYIWDAVNLDLTHTGSGAVGAAGTNFDQIAMAAGNFTISGGTISLNFASSIDLATHTTSTFWSASEKWQILSGANTINGTPLFSMSGGSFDSSGNVTVSGTLLGHFAFDSSGFLDWTPVPEPGSLALAGFAAAGLAGYAWRRRKNKAQTTTLLSSGDDANTGGLLNECFREVIHE